MRSRIFLAACAGLVFAPHARPTPLSSAGIETGGGNRTQVIRAIAVLPAGFEFARSADSVVSIDWDFSIAYWRLLRAKKLPQRDSLWDLGFGPSFRWHGAAANGVYATAGIGMHLLSQHYDNNGRILATAGQFASHLGMGYRTDGSFDWRLSLQHVSNGGIKGPNSGVNFLLLRLAYGF